MAVAPVPVSARKVYVPVDRGRRLMWSSKEQRGSADKHRNSVVVGEHVCVWFIEYFI